MSEDTKLSVTKSALDEMGADFVAFTGTTREGDYRVQGRSRRTHETIDYVVTPAGGIFAVVYGVGALGF